MIDTHQHIWDPKRAAYEWLGPDLAEIDRPIYFDELRHELRDAGVDFTVQVQSADDPDDTALMIESASMHPEVAGIVGYAPIDRPEECAATIEAWAGDSLMVGVRTLIHNQADPDWLLRPDVDEGLSVLEGYGLAFDVVSVLPRHLEHVPVIAERHPDLRLVIDHLSKPPIGLADREPWWSLIAAAAEHPNVHAKISGLYSATGDPAAWTTELVEPFVDRAVEVFGFDRLMYGGDWPISILAGGYTRVWNGLRPIFERFAPHEREQVLGRTAASFYRLSPARLGLG
ncbi:metal-dependent hydrolase [Agromyces rhizosphaerae]|uniref:Metal-dependent hydrolase n=1 Tax=Agromyces rhizosphaerae TaxID=88374 RepID=A0A9W6CWR2_9MICO|nr:metal-dependent hydrolase [Agromyces rhizosphaerae]